jgi:hypothetical protein
MITILLNHSCCGFGKVCSGKVDWDLVRFGGV